MFGWDWDFEIIDEKFDLEIGQAYVKGKLTCRVNGKPIIKMQFGRADIKFKKAWDNELKKSVPTKLPLDIGNDLKAASTDALKKCASELGIASDVYAPNEFKHISIKKPTSNEEKLEKIKELLEVEGLKINEDDRMNIERIVEEKDTLSYKKALTLLISKTPKK
jgi:isopentenyldiphosphate isomerase